MPTKSQPSDSRPSKTITSSPADDEAEDVEVEDKGANHGVKPWDPQKIRISTKAFSLREVVEQIKEREIDLSPDFQRDYVWKARQRTRLIESLLLGIPLPAFYFNQESDGTYQVVDGVQRLSTISLFMADEHVLERNDLEYLHDLAGRTYSEFDNATTRRFRSTQIVVHVIEPQTPDEVKYDIFSRVNTLGSPLAPQEIRHAMSSERSRTFLKTLTELPSFASATNNRFSKKVKKIQGGTGRNTQRMMDRELALRFCAFRAFSEEEYRTHESLDAFLIDYTRRIDGRSSNGNPITDVQLKRLEADFNRAMTNALELLGNAAFRRYPPGQSRRGPLNRAVFESQALALADFPAGALTSKKEQVLERFRALFQDPDYLRNVTVSTGDPVAIANRLRQTRSVLAGFRK